MKELKSAILAIFQKGPGWLCPVSMTPKNLIKIWKILFGLCSYEFLATLEGKNRKGSIWQNNSVSTVVSNKNRSVIAWVWVLES